MSRKQKKSLDRYLCYIVKVMKKYFLHHIFKIIKENPIVKHHLIDEYFQYN